MYVPVLIAMIAVTTALELSPVDDARAKFYDLEQNLSKKGRLRDGYSQIAEAFVTWDKHIQSISTLAIHQLDSWLWKTASEQMQAINVVYETFASLMRNSLPDLPQDELEALAHAVLEGEKSIPIRMNELEQLLEYSDKYLYDLAQEDPSETCATSVFQAKLIYDMYSTLALAQLKGYAMTQLSRMLLRTYDAGTDVNYTHETTVFRERYANTAGRAAFRAKTAISAARRDIYMCDPPVHIEGETYEQVTRLLQAYVENEVDMNEYQTCGDNCPAYTSTRRYGCYGEQFCDNQKICKGEILECRFVESHMTVCTASRSSNRMYEWIQYDSGYKLGEVTGCPRQTTRVQSWYRGFYHCSYCLCLCDDDTYSHRYFSLREATSDVHNNKIVTGIRLVKHDRVFHLQVHEGRLLERGAVEAVGWVPVHKFDPSDYGVHESRDYHKLSYRSRAINLNKIELPDSRLLLTGVRFRILNGNLHFEIQSTPFDYITGQLLPNMSRWEDSMRPWIKLNLQNPDIPTRSPSKLHVASNLYQYVEFTHSDFDADAAQSTVPFIDVQPVLPSKGTGLARGAGVVLRGAAGSGGFLELQLIMHQYADHVAAPPPPFGVLQYDPAIDTNIYNENGFYYF